MIPGGTQHIPPGGGGGGGGLRTWDLVTGMS